MMSPRRFNLFNSMAGLHSVCRLCGYVLAKNGAWGPQAQRIFKDLCAMLSVRTMSADLYGWSAMTFEKHWLQRIGVTQARARAALLTEGVRSRQQAACEVPWGPGVETVSMQYAA